MKANSGTKKGPKPAAALTPDFQSGEPSSDPPSNPVENSFLAEVKRRFGLLPNFFALAPKNPEIIANLWGFACFAYLDNPLPSLFKERLFVYLSRFCEVRYCIARHVGFLVGLGHASGDAECPIQSVEQVIRLIRRPFARGADLEPLVAGCEACVSPLSELPEPDSPMELAIFACASHVFVQTANAPRCVEALKRVLGESRLQNLLMLLTFVRTAHYWTVIHRELGLEEDINELLAAHERLAQCLFNDPEAGACDLGQKLMEELTALREDAARSDKRLKTQQRESDERLRLSNVDLAQRLTQLEQANNQTRDSRRAALNLMQDAVISRQAVEKLNGELRESEEAVMRERDFAEAILRSSPISLLVLENDLRVHSANEAFYDTFQVQANETVGRLVFELGSGQWNIPRLRQLLESVSSNDSLFTHFEVVHDFEKIGRRVMLLNACRMKNDPAAPRRIILVIDDITVSKQAEEALRHAHELLTNEAAHLDTLVQERTVRLQETIAELEHFSYTITHDMRAPLRAMHGFGSMVLEDTQNHLTSQSADYLTRIIKGARRMDALICDSLQFAKVVRERLPLSPVEPLPILRDILESYEVLQPPHVRIQLAESFPPVIAHETGLAQCFSNLLVNAVKFVPPGVTPAIRVWAESGSALPAGEEGGTTPSVRFWFEDNGIGIPREYHDRIFEMFQQLDKSYGGTGIGLALVRKTAERMGGKVGVESASGNGSRFWIELKAALNEETK